MMGPETHPDEETLQRVLNERARVLDRPAHEEVRADGMEMVILAVDQERYGIPLEHLLEVQPLSGLTRVPGLPAHWAGIVNIRGHLFPILHLCRYLGAPSAPATRHRMVLVSASGLQVGLLADEVLEVRRIPHHEISPPLHDRSGSGREFISGISQELITLINLPALLADPRLQVHMEAT